MESSILEEGCEWGREGVIWVSIDAENGGSEDFDFDSLYVGVDYKF